MVTADKTLPFAGLVAGGILLYSGILNERVIDVIMLRGKPLSTGEPAGSSATQSAENAASDPDGNAHVESMINEASAISGNPYVWGGGHGALGVASIGIPGGPGYDGHTVGFDCSGAVSAVLGAGGFVTSPETSVGLMGFGQSGPGKHVSIWANPTHTFMEIDGTYFGTGNLGVGGGPRWGNGASENKSSFVVRHPPGL